MKQLAILLVLAVAAPAFAQVNIAPGTTIQTVIDANPAGTTYVLQAGTHRPGLAERNTT
jgi:hypothetical protein